MQRYLGLHVSIKSYGYDAITAVLKRISNNLVSLGLCLCLVGAAINEDAGPRNPFSIVVEVRLCRYVLAGTILSTMRKPITPFVQQFQEGYLQA